MKITAFFLFHVLLITTAFGQDYKPMLTENSEWHEYFTVWPEGNATLRIGEDSIFNGVAYKKIFAAPGYGAILDPGSIRFLREDTLERKIYKYHPFSEMEVVLYDFSLMLSDTFYWDEDNFMVLDSITNSIVNLFYCNGHNMPTLSIENPRVFYFNGSGSTSIVWVEGIGSLAGLLKNYHAWGGGVLNLTLLCHYNQFRERDFHYIYCEEFGDCKGYQHNIDNVEEFSNQHTIDLYPNPTKGLITISSEDPNVLKDAEIIIYDLQGREQIRYKNITNLNLNSLTKGIYFIKIRSDNQQIYIQKIIKQ